MTAPTPAHLELVRMARLLGVDVAALDGLSDLPAEDLRVLRDQIAALLFDQGREAFQRAANVASTVPAGLAAKMAQHALGPVLAARTTAVTPTAKSVELASKFPASFLADVAVELDPRVVDDLVRALPPDIIAAVGDQLAARGEWLVMADFVGSITRDALDATMHALSDEAILRVALLLEHPERMDEIVSLLEDERLASIVDTAGDLELYAELEALVSGLGDDQRSRIPA